MNELFARTAVAAVLAAVIAGAAMRARALTGSGALAAFAVGTVVAGVGGWRPGAVLVLFFVSSSALSRFGRPDGGTARRGATRDAVQVLANGGIASICCLLSAVDEAHREIWLAGAIGSVAAVAADTWATEIGRRSRAIPRLLTTAAPVPRGTSGGVTVVGTAGSIAGAALMAAAAAIHLQPGAAGWSMRDAAAIALAGIAGSLIDSLIGAVAQARYRCPACGQESERPVDRCQQRGTLIKGLAWVDNDVVNVAAAIAGATVAMLLYAR